MKKLHRYELEYEETWRYVSSNLDGANTLSSEIVDLLSYKKGRFFTLLPTAANLPLLYEFETGGILPQKSEKDYVIDNRKATYSEIPTIREELADLILKTANKEKLFCIFDDVLRLANDKNSTNLFKSNGLIYNDEVYYILDRNQIDNELIIKCLDASNAFWHSLGILTKTVTLNFNSKRLDLEMLKNICINAQLIMIGAYDGEGYLFWERA